MAQPHPLLNRRRALGLLSAAAGIGALPAGARPAPVPRQIRPGALVLPTGGTLVIRGRDKSRWPDASRLR